MNATHMPHEFSSSDWARYAHCYDTLLSLRPYVDTLNKVALLSSVLPHRAVLDASCGTGNFEQVLARHVDELPRIVGIDMSTDMLRIARKKLGAFDSVSFVQASLDGPIGLSDRSFSQVVSINTLYAVTDPMVTLQEFHRLLDDDGFLVLVTPKFGFENGLALKEHCKSTKPDSYWEDVHADSAREEMLIREAFDDEATIQAMLTVAAFNRHIAHERTFHFFNSESLRKLLLSVGFILRKIEYTYANQDFFIVAQKGGLQ
jgi:ubiquinone/menaquinone biosynthesis C-methylase UbiE